MTVVSLKKFYLIQKKVKFIHTKIKFMHKPLWIKTQFEVFMV